jgi:hypothetical protein
MSTAANTQFQYTVGGSLEKNAPSYVVREADQQFYEALKAGKFCYVLNCRQMGKSSLRVQTMQRLQNEGIGCGIIDISAIKSASTEADWYLSFVKRLAGSLKVMKTLAVERWWNERSGSPLDRFAEFIDEVVLAQIDSPIVIFIDEIDSILRFEAKDDFFALVRSYFIQRPDSSEYNRLAFALLGVATPGDLIQDKSRTPFNIGTAIDLQGFQRKEVEPLTRGLAGKAENPEAAMAEILDWTGGQPFLTQKVCRLVAESPFPITAGSEAELVGNLVQSRIIANWEAQDEPQHLRTIRDRLTSQDNEAMAGRLLGMHQQILQDGSIAADGSSEQMELRLSGLVVQRQGQLRIYNRIYREVFNQQWVQQELDKLRPYAEALNAWLKSGKQDESRLLQGGALAEALQWRKGKQLSLEDDEFLDACRDREVAAVKAESSILEVANRKAARRIKIGTGILILAVVGAAILGWFGMTAAQRAEKNHQEADKQTTIAKREKQAAEKAKLEATQQKELLNNASTKLKQINKLMQSAEKKRQQAEQQSQAARNREKQAHQQQQAAQQAAQSALSAKADAQTRLGQISQAKQQATIALKQAEAEKQQAETAAAAAKQEEQHLVAEKAAVEQEKESANIILQATEAKVNATESKSAWLDRKASFDALAFATRSGNQLLNLPASKANLKPADKQRLEAIEVQSKAALNQALADVQERNRLEGQSPVNSVSFSPDGNTLASGSWDKTVKLWDVKSGKEIATLQGHQSWVNSVSFSPDGHTLASGSEDKTVKLWDVKSGKEIASLQGHQSPVWSVSFSPDGHTLASGSGDNTVKLWDVKSGKEIATLEGH